jgi:DNA-binding transcriptional ArsR family regulator
MPLAAAGERIMTLYCQIDQYMTSIGWPQPLANTCRHGAAEPLGPLQPALIALLPGHPGQSHTQIRSVFSDPLVLEPLALGDVEQLLANRYEALQLDPARPWRSPVESAVVQRLYELFRGDLRGLLKALEDGITALLGLTSAGTDVAPVGLEDLLLTLRQRNQTELQEQLGETAWDRLLAWAQVDAASVQTQAELVELWQVRQPTVSQTLQPLIEAGAVEALPRRGREAIRYLMTGTARLAL